MRKVSASLALASLLVAMVLHAAGIEPSAENAGIAAFALLSLSVLWPSPKFQEQHRHPRDTG